MQKDAYYFPHFCNARSDRKLKRLRKELDIEGYGIYFMMLEVLREQPDFKYPVEDLDLLADEFGTSEQKTRAVVLNYGLFELNEEEEFFSIKLIEYLEPYLKSKESRRVGGVKGNLIKYGKLSKEEARKMTDEEIILFNDGQKVAKLEEFSHTDSVTDSATDRLSSQSKVKEKKVKEKKVKETIKKTQHLDALFFTDEEKEKLKVKYPNAHLLKLGLEKLNNYIMSIGTKYKSHYHVMIGWVYDDICGSYVPTGKEIDSSIPKATLEQNSARDALAMEKINQSKKGSE